MQYFSFIRVQVIVPRPVWWAKLNGNGNAGETQTKRCANFVAFFCTRKKQKKRGNSEKKLKKTQNDAPPPAQCAVPAAGKEGCTTVLNPPGSGRGVHANALLQTLLQKVFMRRSTFKEFIQRVTQGFHTPVTLRVRRNSNAVRIPPSLIGCSDAWMLGC